MILSTVRDVLHEGRGRDMSIWPFGGNCFLTTRNREDVGKGFPEPSRRKPFADSVDGGQPYKIRGCVELTKVTNAAHFPCVVMFLLNLNARKFECLAVRTVHTT